MRRKILEINERNRFSTKVGDKFAPNFCPHFTTHSIRMCSNNLGKINLNFKFFFSPSLISLILFFWIKKFQVPSNILLDTFVSDVIVFSNIAQKKNFRFQTLSSFFFFLKQFFLNPFFSHCVSLMIEQCDCYRIGGNKKHSDQ